MGDGVEKTPTVLVVPVATASSSSEGGSRLRGLSPSLLRVPKQSPRLSGVAVLFDVDFQATTSAAASRSREQGFYRGRFRREREPASHGHAMSGRGFHRQDVSMKRPVTSFCCDLRLGVDNGCRDVSMKRPVTSFWAGTLALL